MSESSEDGIFLTILPAKHRFVDLLIEDMHRQRLHAGVSQTLSELRATYWIIKGRHRVKFVLHGCIPCKRLQGPSFKQPVAPLPMERCSEAPPFTTSGLDFAGPLYSKDSEGKEQKTYTCLFTCAVTRAIHLELVTSMSTSEFLLAF